MKVPASGGKSERAERGERSYSSVPGSEDCADRNRRDRFLVHQCFAVHGRNGRSGCRLPLFLHGQSRLDPDAHAVGRRDVLWIHRLYAARRCRQSRHEVLPHGVLAVHVHPDGEPARD